MNMKIIWKSTQFENRNSEFCKKCGEKGCVVVINGVYYCQSCHCEYKA